MSHLSMAERLERAKAASAVRAMLGSPVARRALETPERCFTAVDPAGATVFKFTRLTRRGVQRAIASALAGRDDGACENWPAAERAGWQVVPVSVVQRAEEGGR